MIDIGRQGPISEQAVDRRRVADLGYNATQAPWSHDQSYETHATRF